MQLNFRERFTFRHKGPKLRFSLLFQKVLPSDYLGLVLNKSSCNSHCKPCVKNFVFMVRPKMLLTDLIAGFAKIEYRFMKIHRFSLI